MNKWFWVLMSLCLPLTTLAAPARTVICGDSKPILVTVPVGRVTVLNFPTTPKDVVPGEAGFDFKTIRQDLVVKVMRLGVKTNLFVYLEGRRCFFHLVSALTGDEILFVRDSKETAIEVKFVDK